METFDTFVERESFTAAVDKLKLSKSLASNQVSLREEYFGTRLLYRTTRKLSLSDTGSTCETAEALEDKKGRL
jgi:DNA-binding transcriptional LysR family regulator